MPQSKPRKARVVLRLQVARLLLPLRFGAALAMAPWVDENIMRLGLDHMIAIGSLLQGFGLLIGSFF